MALLIRVVGATLKYRDVNAPGVPVGHTLPGPVVFAFWHCSMLTCAHRFRNLGIAILISRSFDGELIARTVERLGFLAVRGSSSRGGASGLKGMADAYAAGHRCAFTADGPRGPARVSKAGPVQLAELDGGDVDWRVSRGAFAGVVFEELGSVCDSEAVFYGDVWLAGACGAGAGAGAEGAG